MEIADYSVSGTEKVVLKNLYFQLVILNKT